MEKKDNSLQTQCFIFPGQGAQSLRMIEDIQHASSFQSRYELIKEILETDPIDAIKNNPNYLNENLVSSLLTVLVSSLSYELLKCQLSPHYLAGYSVGQWTALWVAQSLSFEQLIQLLAVRAQYMNDCLQDQLSGMIAVIGVNENSLKELCFTVQKEGHYLAISNYNAVGQFTLAGTEEALKMAVEMLPFLNPKKYQRIPVSGAWHCELLKPAANKFRDYLEEVELRLPQYPILDNVTGKFLPTEMNLLKNQLAEHLCSPVVWGNGIQYLINKNCHRFIEVGYGKTLIKFGFFIDRSVTHQSFYTRFE